RQHAAARLPQGRFFFFQAEDGIRDKLVTGVQTCALPISPRGLARDNGSRNNQIQRVPTLELNPEQRKAVEHGEGPLLVIAGPGRSEERRVGKECRSWWLRYEEKSIAE